VSTTDLDDPILRRIASLQIGDYDSEERKEKSAIRTGDTTSEIIPENLARRWMVGVETARQGFYETCHNNAT
jgi:hypothetical protein